MRQLAEVHRLSDEQVTRVRSIFANSGFIGQGNPAITVHPARAKKCEADPALPRIGRIGFQGPDFERICGAPYMAPLYDLRTAVAEEGRACIDQFEFPDLPGVYPVVWVRAKEAAELCEAVGKRLCDAHEWEGACAGRLEPPDYNFELARGVDPATAVKRMRARHNRLHAQDKVWSYGSSYRTGVCAASSRKSPECGGGDWATCGSNTFPAGCFPECRTSLGVYDLHGNAAEHMNLPLDESQMSSGGRGSGYLRRGHGYTEMKGSWFIFDGYKAHEDHCRWRAPFWHGSRVMAEHSHRNYHLGFRCCKTIERN
ncbi:MAG: hypothetical protein GY769_07250 [bacterium]|nr:hypothetical protein [bacterium]